MKVSIFGLGYVGSVTAACLAAKGHIVIGVDPNPAKIDCINSAQAPVAEPGLEELLTKSVASGLLRATSNPEEAILHSDISLICVGTPAGKGGLPDYGHLKTVCIQIGRALARKKQFHVVAVRSTVLPGVTQEIVVPLIEKHSGLKLGSGFAVCHHPEFLREGAAVKDFYFPSRIIIGEAGPHCGDMLAQLYGGTNTPIIHCGAAVSEMVKYADNAWHANKVVFANEIGTICKSHGIDSHAVMDIFCRDDKLNLSAHYLRPGFAFGGSCLPKDVRALTGTARQKRAATPLLNALLPANAHHIERGVRMIMGTRKKSVGFLGITFKAGTDDMRESPLVNVVQRLLSRGRHVRLFDRNIDLRKLTGANRDYIYSAIPRIGQLLKPDINQVLDDSDVIVIGHHDREFASVAKRLRRNQTVIDFVRIPEIEKTHGNYHGICW